MIVCVGGVEGGAEGIYLQYPYGYVHNLFIYTLFCYFTIVHILLCSPFGAQLRPFLASVQGPSGGTSVGGRRPAL